MIEVKSLTKRFEGREILSDLSVRFDAGQVVAIVGPSGGGKSTLLRCINGLTDFDAGEVRAFGQTLRSGDERPNREARLAVRRRVGFVFQQWNLFAHRSAIGNVVEAPVHVKGIAPAVATARAEELLEKVGLAHRKDAYPHEMSGGEQQRVAIARALAMDPEAILLDEPTSALDPARTREVLAVLRRLADEGTTMILVTHERSFVREVAQRAVLLAEGKIAADGPAAEVLADD
ncbi:MAG: amino acid ABC transporter ATP-binding protein [Polyangiaceae bacterium]